MNVNIQNSGQEGGSVPPRVGMVGAGQLARMTYQAGIPLGLTLRVLSEKEDESAARVGAQVILGSPNRLEDLRTFAATCDVVTFDHELVPPEHLVALEAEGHRLYPSAATMALAQNKRRQRAELGALGFPVPPNTVVAEASDLTAFGEAYGWPVVAKAARGGYDGRGVWVLDGPEAAQRLVADTAPRGVELIVETWVPIEREIAVLIARRPSGKAVVYPVVETVQVNGICREILAPAPISSALAREAEQIGLQIAEAIGATGVLAIEMFVVDERRSAAFSGTRIVINELAARPHNSGHYSIEGCVTSQFENHLRAVLDWPLGDPALVAPAVVTVNVLGGPLGNDPQQELPEALQDPRVKVHLYGKEARPGRKLGHVTALGQTIDEARTHAVRAVEILTGGEQRVR